MNKICSSLFFLLFTLIYFPGQAQKYRTAAGLRIGRDDFGITVQQKIRKQTTLEGIAAFGGREVSATALIEQHFPMLGPSFNLYAGAGAHVGNLKDRGAYFGGDLIVGAELKLPIMPVVLSLDLKPAFHVNHDEWGSVPGGFSIRYILIKEKKEKKKLFGIFNRNDDKNKRKKKQAREKKKGLGGILDIFRKEKE